MALGCEEAGVRWRWSAKGLECDGAAPRKAPGVTVRDGAGWCGTALDGTTGRKRAQPGATRRKRAQPGAAGHNQAQAGATGRNRAQPGTEGGLAALQTL